MFNPEAENPKTNVLGMCNNPFLTLLAMTSIVSMLSKARLVSEECSQQKPYNKLFFACHLTQASPYVESILH